MNGAKRLVLWACSKKIYLIYHYLISHWSGTSISHQLYLKLGRFKISTKTTLQTFTWSWSRNVRVKIRCVVATYLSHLCTCILKFAHKLCTRNITAIFSAQSEASTFQVIHQFWIFPKPVTNTETMQYKLIEWRVTKIYLMLKHRIVKTYNISSRI